MRLKVPQAEARGPTAKDRHTAQGGPLRSFILDMLLTKEWGRAGSAH